MSISGRLVVMVMAAPVECGGASCIDRDKHLLCRGLAITPVGARLPLQGWCWPGNLRVATPQHWARGPQSVQLSVTQSKALSNAHGARPCTTLLQQTGLHLASAVYTACSRISMRR